MCPSSLLADQLRRRRDAAARLVPLADGRTDALDPSPAGWPTDRELVAWSAACGHLDGLGLPALVPADVRTALRWPS
jgi:hypothetical protein